MFSSPPPCGRAQLGVINYFWYVQPRYVNNYFYLLLSHLNQFVGIRFLQNIYYSRVDLLEGPRGLLQYDLASDNALHAHGRPVLVYDDVEHAVRSLCIVLDHGHLGEIVRRAMDSSLFSVEFLS